MAVKIATSADIDADAQIGEGSQIWHLAQVRGGAVLVYEPATLIGRWSCPVTATVHEAVDATLREVVHP